MKRIIIAGASGFIGKNLCTALVKEGYEVITVTRGKEKTRNLNYKRINWSQTKTLKKEIEGS